jgi:hypothetical protein
MTWRDLLQTERETIVFPWVGGKSLRWTDDRVWTIEGRFPREFGWHEFGIQGRKAKVLRPVPAEPGSLSRKVRGYLVGDRIVPDDARVDPDPTKITAGSEAVYLIEDGLDRFVRISAGRVFEGGPLIYDGLEMPLGPEEAVLGAFLDQATRLDGIPGVTPALEAAFRMETHQRAEAERRRLEQERKRQEEEERRAKEERRRQLVEQLGDGAGRRAMAQVDFDQAARAALAVGGAEFLDSRQSPNRGERVVRFRLERRRFECTCNERTLQILDAGVCLTAHYDDEAFEGGTKGDTWFTLESLPGVIREAQGAGRLVVFRHVN